MPRGGTPLGFSAPSLEASNQAQIDDLVQRNRTLQHTKQKLSEQLANETARSNETLSELQKQWQLEKAEWRHGCDVLQSCHRVVQLRNVVQLEGERMNVLKELNGNRKEKLLRLQRDFRITMFQAREAELEDRIRELEEQREAIVAKFEESLRQMKGKNAQYVAQVQAKNDQLAVAEQRNEQLQAENAELRDEKVRFRSTEKELVIALERVTLQLEGAHATRDDLKRTNEELKRTNSDLLRQLDKWQTLENKGGAEAESHRKKRVELEVQVKDLELQLEKTREEHEKALEKEKRKIEKYKNGVQEWQAEAENHQQDAEEALRQLAKSEKRVTKLKDALEDERARVRPPSPEKRRATSPLETILDDDVGEVSPQPSPLPEPPTTRPKPRARKAETKPPSKVRSPESGNAEAGPSSTKNEEVTKAVKKRKAKPQDSDIEEVPPVEKPGPRPRSQVSPTMDDVEFNGDPEDMPQKAKSKGKAKAVEEREAVDVAAPEQPQKKRSNKRKAAKDDDGHGDIEIVLPTQKGKKGAGTKHAGKELRDTGTKPRRARSTSIQTKLPSPDVEREPDIEQEQAVKKKKRKINIFATNVEATAFNFMPDSDGGLNIPTVLSPVKESEGVPNRSTSGSVIGTIGSMLRNSFTRR